MGVDYMQLPVVDYTGVASLCQIQKGIDFICKHKKLNQTVYIHCKAGRYRSALLVACYLIKDKQMTPESAIDYIKNLRPHVILYKKRQFNTLSMYYNTLYLSQK